MNIFAKIEKKTGRKGMVAIIAAIVIVIVLITVLTAVRSKGTVRQKMILDCDFTGGTDIFSGEAYYQDRDYTCEAVPAGGIDDSPCIKLTVPENNDARFKGTVPCSPKTYYRISAWVKTENVASGDSRIGANISILNTFEYSGNLYGDNDWTKVEFYGLTGDRQKSFDLCLRIGFYSGDNSGTAYFDNVQVEQLSSLPSGKSAILFDNQMSSGNSSAGKLSSTEREVAQKYDDTMLAGMIILGISVLFLVVLYRYGVAEDRYGLPEPEYIMPEAASDGEEKNSGEIKPVRIGFRGLDAKGCLFVMLAIGLVIRIIVAVAAPQCSIDVNLFKSWGNHCLEDGITNFYAKAADYHLDYPPLYIYFLTFNAFLARTFGLVGTTGYTLLVKLPSIIADCIIAVLIYRTGENRLKKSWLNFIVAAWLFNPLVILDSAAWGQVDSILTLFCVFMIYFLSKDQYIKASVFLGLAIILKPQGIFMVPIIGYALVKRFFKEKDIPKSKTLILMAECIGTVLATVTIVALPFGIKMEGGLFKWIVSLYIGTANGYKGATVNSYNFFYVLKKNWTDDSIKWIFGKSFFFWGMIFIVVSCLLAWVLYHRAEKKRYVPFMIASMLVYAVTMFGPRMHERYFYPCVGLMLFAVLLSDNRHLLRLYALTSIVNFASVLSIMMGLEVGGELNAMGASYDAYAQYYWAGEALHRRIIAVSNLAICTATIITVTFIALGVFKKRKEKDRIWKTEDVSDE